MDLNDLEPKNVKPKPINLEVMSIEALYDYIGELEDEINRTKNEISAKEVARKGAEEVFKKNNNFLNNIFIYKLSNQSLIMNYISSIIILSLTILFLSNTSTLPFRLRICAIVFSICELSLIHNSPKHMIL